MGLDSHTIGILFATAAALAWAVFTFTMKMALRGASVIKTTVFVNALNAILVTAIALTIVPPAEFIPKSAESAVYLVLAGIFHIAMARLVFYIAIQRLGPNRALPIGSSYPIVTAVSAALMLGERPTPQILAGLIILLGGITLIVRAEPGKAEPGEPATPAWRMTGWACAAATAFLWGIAAIFFKKAAMEMHPLAVSALALWVGFAAVWLAARWLDPDGVVPFALLAVDRPLRLLPDRRRPPLHPRLHLHPRRPRLGDRLHPALVRDSPRLALHARGRKHHPPPHRRRGARRRGHDSHRLKRRHPRHLPPPASPPGAVSPRPGQVL